MGLDTEEILVRTVISHVYFCPLAHFKPHTALVICNSTKSVEGGHDLTWAFFSSYMGQKSPTLKYMEGS